MIRWNIRCDLVGTPSLLSQRTPPSHATRTAVTGAGRFGLVLGKDLSAPVPNDQRTW